MPTHAVRTERRSSLVIVLGFALAACAAPTRSAPSSIDPASVESVDETPRARLSPLIAPGPELVGAVPETHANSTMPPADMALMAMGSPDSQDSGVGRTKMEHHMSDVKSGDRPADMGGMNMGAMKRSSADAGAHEMKVMEMEMGVLGSEEHLRGSLAKIWGSSITVKLTDGNAVEVLTDKKTRFERDDAPAAFKDLTVGQRVVLYASKVKSRYLARLVRLSPATTSSSASSSPPDAGTKSTDALTTPALVYTCPMHPEIRESKPGKCPKCGMKLQLVEPTKATK